MARCAAASFAISLANVATTSVRCSSSSAAHTGAVPGTGRVSRKPSGSCTVTPLLSWRRLVRDIESTKESVDDGARAEQLREGCQPCVLTALSLGQCLWRVQVSPCRGDQRARTVAQHQHQMQLSAPMHPAEYLQRLSLEGVATPDDRYVLGIAFEVAVMGSVSSGLSMPSTMDGWSALSSTAWEIRG